MAAFAGSSQRSVGARQGVVFNSDGCSRPIAASFGANEDLLYQVADPKVDSKDEWIPESFVLTDLGHFVFALGFALALLTARAIEHRVVPSEKYC